MNVRSSALAFDIYFTVTGSTVFSKMIILRWSSVAFEYRELEYLYLH